LFSGGGGSQDQQSDEAPVEIDITLDLNGDEDRSLRTRRLSDEVLRTRQEFSVDEGDWVLIGNADFGLITRRGGFFAGAFSETLQEALDVGTVWRRTVTRGQIQITERFFYTALFEVDRNGNPFRDENGNLTRQIAGTRGAERLVGEVSREFVKGTTVTFNQYRGCARSDQGCQILPAEIGSVFDGD